MEIFVAFGPYRIELRHYLGCSSVPELVRSAQELQKEAEVFASTMGLPEPAAPRVTSTFMGVTLIAEVPFRNPTVAAEQAIKQFIMAKQWKLSRK
jgi:hypothetical protein